MLRVALVCVGRMKAGLERDLEARYLDRAKAAGRGIGLEFAIITLDESRARSADERRLEESRLITAAVGGAAKLLILDERGEAIDSRAFAAIIGAARDEGCSDLILAIGGADGLDPSLQKAAIRTLAFGRMTWPHQLVRVMACNNSTERSQSSAAIPTIVTEMVAVRLPAIGQPWAAVFRTPSRYWLSPRRRRRC